MERDAVLAGDGVPLPSAGAPAAHALEGAQYGRWLFSLLLATLAVYGYRMWRILIAYALIITAYAANYFALGLHPALGKSLQQQEALLASLTAFHGRVFSISFALVGPQSWVTGLEAITGLSVESTFIAMLMQRFFGT